MVTPLTEYLSLINKKTGNTRQIYDSVDASAAIKDLHRLVNRYAENLSLPKKEIPVPVSIAVDKTRRKVINFTFDSELDLTSLNNAIVDTKLESSVNIPNLEGSNTTLGIKSSATKNVANSIVPEL